MITVNDRLQIVSSSNGNQIKWKENNRWYKIDRNGNEGLAESIVSNLLCFSNCESFVMYQEEIFQCNHQSVLGCSSENFLPEPCNLITTAKIFKQAYGTSPDIICHTNSLEDKMLSFVRKLSKLVSLSEREVGEYLTMMFELDAFILNTDRHYNNIAFIQNGENFYPAPIFDNGNALFSTDYTTGDLQKKISKTIAKPFLCSFPEQKEIMESYFGTQLQIDVSKFLDNFTMPKLYNVDITKGMLEIIQYQKQQYQDLDISHSKRKEHD